MNVQEACQGGKRQNLSDVDLEETVKQKREIIGQLHADIQRLAQFLEKTHLKEKWKVDMMGNARKDPETEALEIVKGLMKSPAVTPDLIRGLQGQVDNIQDFSVNLRKILNQHLGER